MPRTSRAELELRQIKPTILSTLMGSDKFTLSRLEGPELKRGIRLLYSHCYFEELRNGLQRQGYRPSFSTEQNAIHNLANLTYNEYINRSLSAGNKQESDSVDSSQEF